MEHILQFGVQSWEGMTQVTGNVFKDIIIQAIETNQLFHCRRLDGEFEISLTELETLLRNFGKLYSHPDILCSISQDLVIICNREHSHCVPKSTEEIFSVSVSVYAKERNIRVIHGELDKILSKYAKPTTYATITWAYRQQGEIRFAEVKSLMQTTLYKEAYPYIENLDETILNYLDSSSPVLILMGPACTGKTRLIKYIIHQIIKRSGNANVLYSMDNEVFSEEVFFLKFLIEKFSAMVLEDIDFSLKPRKDGNTFMVKLLNSSDGLVSAENRKIIMSTNLSGINETDDALVRKGRCFDVIKTRRLDKKETNTLINSMGYTGTFDPVKEVSLADIYDAINTTCLTK